MPKNFGALFSVQGFTSIVIEVFYVQAFIHRFGHSSGRI
jgi:hypothetical protein